MTKKQKQALAAEEAALAEAKSKEARRLAGLEKYRKRNLQQKNYRKTISAKAKVQMKKQQNQIEEQDLPGKDDAAIQQLASSHPCSISSTKATVSHSCQEHSG